MDAYKQLMAEARQLCGELLATQPNYKDQLTRVLERVGRLGAHPGESPVAGAAVSGALSRATTDAFGWPSQFVTRAEARRDFYSLLARAVDAAEERDSLLAGQEGK